MADCCCDMDYYHSLTVPEKMWPGAAQGHWEYYHVHAFPSTSNGELSGIGSAHARRRWVPYPSGKETMLANIRETYLSKRGE